MTKAELRDVDRRIERLLKSQEEFRKSQEEEFRKSQEEFRKGNEELREAQKKTDEQLKKTDEELRAMFKKREEEQKKVDKQIENLLKSVDGVTKGIGRIPEGLAFASFKRIFKGLGMSIEWTNPNLRRRCNGKEMEIDILSLVKKDNQNFIISIEAKVYLTIKDVGDLLEDIKNFYNFFPEYRDIPLIAGLAFTNYAENAKVYAEKKGIYLLSLSDDTMTLANSKDFNPKVWVYGN
ncbi:MAG: hypothetical protein AB1422_05545 [bacterium]